ncbi:tetratricopeptide repeat protein, partial [Nocardia sp. NPDC004722]
VVVGWSKVGKTRTLFEAVRRVLPTASMLVPDSDTLHRIPSHPAYGRGNETIVIWLDDLDRFLTNEHPLTPALLTHLRTAHPGRTIVAATLRREAYERLRKDDGELTYTSRTLLNQTTRIALESTVGNAFEHVAAETGYPDLDLERYRAQGYGLGEVLAGAPALLERYEHADSRLRAIIQVAVDWQRIGRQDPIPEPILLDLADRTARRIQPNLRADFAATTAALTAATEPMEHTARIAALETIWFSDDDCGYRAFDYLVAADDGHHSLPARSIPDSFWDAATRHADHEILIAAGMAAGRRGREDIAIALFQRPAEAGNTSAMNNYGALLRKSGDIERGEDWVRRASEAGSYHAMGNYGYFLAERGDREGAERWYVEGIAGGDLNAMNNFGLLLQQRGDIAEAEAWWQRAADAGHETAMFNLAFLLAQRDELEAAERWCRKAVDAGHHSGLDILGRTLWIRGHHHAAIHMWKSAAGEGDTAAMVSLGYHLAYTGSNNADNPWYAKAAAAGDTSGLRNLALRLAKRGDSDGAAILFQVAARAGDAMAMYSLGVICDRGGESEAAIAWFRAAAANGDIRAMCRLAAHSEFDGDRTQSDDWLARIAESDKEIPAAARYELGLVYQNRGDLDNAEHHHGKAAMAGYPPAAAVLGFILLDKKQYEQAEGWLRFAAERGEGDAMYKLANLRHSSGDSAEAQDWRWRAIAAGEKRAIAWFRPREQPPHEPVATDRPSRHDLGWLTPKTLASRKCWTETGKEAVGISVHLRR